MIYTFSRSFSNELDTYFKAAYDTPMKTPTQNPQTTDLDKIKQNLAQEWDQLNQTILANLGSDIPLIQMILQHIINSGGKRLRPLVTLLVSKALMPTITPEHIEIAAIIEFVHTATLLHDDVIDHSQQRRGRFSANAMWGNNAAVLVGDFLYSRSFQLLTQRCNNPVMSALSTTTNAIAEGEILQLANQHQLITQSQYLDVIYRKTAILFASACECAAIISNQPADIQRNCFEYGKQLGLAFQIMDDMLDYSAHTATLGKEQGNDIQEGKMTLPLIYTLETSTPEQRNRITSAIAEPTEDNQDIIDWVNQSDALNRCHQLAKSFQAEAIAALDCLIDSPFKSDLQQLAHYACNRPFWRIKTVLLQTTISAVHNAFSHSDLQ